MDKRSLLDNLDSVLLILDECIDNGITLETDQHALASRVTKRAEAESPFSEQSFSQAFQSVKEQVARSLLK